MNNDSKMRAKAKRELKSQINNSDQPKRRDLQETIQELRIHQIELEMQKEELQKAQAEVESSRDRYKQLYEFAPVGIFTCNTDGEIITANTTLAHLLGVPCSDVPGRFFSQFSAQSSQDTYYHHAKAVLADGDEKSCTITLMRSDGSTLLADMKSNIEDVAGEQCIRTSLLDITDREVAETQLHLTSRAIEIASESILITDSKGMIIKVNAAFCTVTGYEKHEVIGQNPKMLQSGRQGTAFYKEMWKGIRETGQWQGDLWNRRKNGEVYPESLSISAIYNSDNEVTNYVGLFSDSSEKMLLEEQLRQAQKMEAVGTLVGGIAHDFNNMLAGITGNLYLAKKLSEHSPVLMIRLDNIDQLSQRAAAMISQMLTFARKGIIQMHNLSFSSFVKEAIKLSRVSIPENIMFHYQIEPADLMIHGDVSQLQQVIMNLLNNARDAVGTAENPEIELVLKSFTADEEFRALHPELTARHLVHLCIRDNGYGISEEHLAMIFDPFFTTKEVGMGTGLGLSMCYGAIKSHYGVIEVESTIGKGSIFHVYLPLLQDAPVIKVTADNSEQTWQGHGEIILLADDEQCIREPVTEVLEEIGYRVLQASDGKMAFELFEAHQGEIRLAILDIVMPYVGGPALATKLRAVSPNLPILFATGYDKERVINESKPIANSEVLTKPFNFDELGQIIRQFMA